MSISSIQALEEAFSAFSIHDFDGDGSMPRRGSLSDRSVVWESRNVHSDDIHGIIQLGDSHLVSGSKDGSLVKTSLDGRRLCSFQPAYESGKPDYTRWVTAIASLTPNLWLHGTRDGTVCLWENRFRCRRSWKVVSSDGHVSKERNLDRVMCFGTAKNDGANKQSFFVGQATQFLSMNVNPSQAVQRFSASVNDWVYVLHPLSDQQMLVVTGTDLAVWEQDGRWYGSHYIIKEGGSCSQRRGAQRPYISSLAQLSSDANHVACSFFGGDVRIVDIERMQYVRCWSEHRDRVWTVVECPVDKWLLASSADDKTIKLWDIRQQRSIFTSQEHEGRVSSLFAHGTNLIAATCPNRPTLEKGALLICRDVRQMQGNTGNR